MAELPRRAVLIAAAVGPLAACSASPDKLIKPATLPAAGQALISTADVPVNSGKVVGDTLITQPRPGVFDAFVARCPHAGCVLTGVSGDTIDCPCHGSRFALDGAVVRGPAMQPLAPVKVTVKGGLIVVS
ncbi:Rieske (2Fe-2S) protein [Candidatus Mycolicibacterium alkanivorans]|uniref:Cytochrome bc1 complex Rieske iron-sulfur subunit n=1 Tax=Candidatus Mycolicibacterium alkanivorans TaxID=2954114 RepID=A0ABS9Z1M3_9MYCO|nr:Rieske (2Fe-2S) protein [Candidatus Mycolicibacterium alkanivorans]MCI4676419.1 Rieske (2Fe-2S) protein [Candidatus Mycolicibacterium alkanivorans]